MAKTVVLDVDGTLMDTNYLHVEAWARAFEDVGHRVPRVELHRQIGKGSELLIREFVEDDETVEKITSLHSEYFAELQEHGHPLPGAKELIASLADGGHGAARAPPLRVLRRASGAWPPSPRGEGAHRLARGRGPRGLVRHQRQGRGARAPHAGAGGGG